jgi:hypothetical protein
MLIKPRHMALIGSRCSSVDIVTGYGLDTGVFSPSAKSLSSSEPLRRALVPIQVPVQWVPGDLLLG